MSPLFAKNISDAKHTGEELKVSLEISNQSLMKQK